ncbi:DUF1631 family protein [Thiorhodococcus mannitoliphagus]|uniref:DUF1631 family protein n=1 Tax=Thiorhodococcus mannitoliphagus TaxID=329406 RepID=A0A6P1DRJ4_9GAMM|nr:DUF1631 family protein [Thiorhodococcus mannitoliphagus]NEX19793.1 DUF1631 family protein [Thiorhodococcus mannitoliphagus]
MNETRHLERRRYLRHGVELMGKTLTPDGQGVPFSVLDICLGGLRLSTMEATAHLGWRNGERHDIQIQLAEDGQVLEATIEVLWRDESLIGARFTGLKEPERQRLSVFVVGLRGDHRRDWQPLDREAAAAAKGILLDLVSQHLPSLLSRMLERTLAALWQRQEHAPSAVTQAVWENDLSLLTDQQLQERLPQAILAAVLENLEQLDVIEVASPATAQAQDMGTSNQLALLDPEIFETWLVKLDCAERLAETLSEPLSDLCSRTAPWCDDSKLAIMPLRFIEILVQALTEIGMSDVVLRPLLLCARAHVSEALWELYRSLLQAIPAPGGTMTKRPAATGAEPGGRPGNSAVSAQTSEDAAIAQPVLSAASEIDHAVSDQGPTAAAPETGMDFSGMLEGLHRLALDPSSQPPPSINVESMAAWRHWVEGLGAEQLKRLPSRRLHERASLAERFLAEMLADEAVVPGFKGIVERLSLHLLAMAIDETDALVAETHPLTNIIDLLDQISRFLPNGRRDHPAFHQEFDKLVQRTAATNAHDQSALSRLAERLNAVEAHLSSLSRSSLSHGAQRCALDERARLAREHVREQLNRAFTGRRIHRTLWELLDLAWRSLLESLCIDADLDADSEPESWQRHWDLLWDVHLATGGDRDPGDRAPANPERVLQQVRQILKGRDVPQHVIDPLIAGIEVAIQHVDTDSMPAEEYRTFAKLEPSPGDEPDTPPLGLDEERWRSGSQVVDAVSIGAILWLRDKDSLRAMRLIWRSTDGSRLGLADPLSDKRIKVLRRSQLVKALLKSRAKTQPTADQKLTQRCEEALLTRFQARLQPIREAQAMPEPATHARMRALLAEMLLATEESRSRTLLGVVELDRFEFLSAHHGLRLEQEIMAAVAAIVAQQLPDLRCVADLGKGRFGLLHSIAHRSEAAELGERLRARIQADLLKTLALDLRLSLSLGLALPEEGRDDAESLLSAANLACLAARHQGGDRTVLFGEGDAAIQEYLAQMRTFISAESAIKAQRNRLRCQRIVPIDPASGDTHHHEILLSVYEEDGSPMALLDFISAAESLQLMREVDAQVIAATLEWLHRHPQEALELGGVAINLSGQSLSDPRLVESIREQLERWAILPQQVSFEVTETAAIADLDCAITLLTGLRAMGCRIALDDFGSGLSSYDYLKRLPVDYVKIDGTFIKDILNSPEDREIVRSFNTIAHFMGKQTIAEYVENADILAALHEIGVDYAQGYGIERPRFLDEHAKPETRAAMP